jgi:hypothetical protein
VPVFSQNTGIRISQKRSGKRIRRMNGLKKVAIDAHSLGDIWLTGLYKVVKDKPTWE